MNLFASVGNDRHRDEGRCVVKFTGEAFHILNLHFTHVIVVITDEIIAVESHEVGFHHSEEMRSFGK